MEDILKVKRIVEPNRINKPGEEGTLLTFFSIIKFSAKIREIEVNEKKTMGS